MIANRRIDLSTPDIIVTWHFESSSIVGPSPEVIKYCQGIIMCIAL